MMRTKRREHQPLEIGTNIITYDQHGFVTNVAGLSIEYNLQDLNKRHPFPSRVGGIPLKGNLLVCLGAVRDSDLKE